MSTWKARDVRYEADWWSCVHHASRDRVGPAHRAGHASRAGHAPGADHAPREAATPRLPPPSAHLPHRQTPSREAALCDKLELSLLSILDTRLLGYAFCALIHAVLNALDFSHDCKAYEFLYGCAALWFFTWLRSLMRSHMATQPYEFSYYCVSL